VRPEETEAKIDVDEDRFLPHAGPGNRHNEED
jgi:hypothetical protein